MSELSISQHASLEQSSCSSCSSDDEYEEGMSNSYAITEVREEFDSRPKARVGTRCGLEVGNSGRSSSSTLLDMACFEVEKIRSISLKNEQLSPHLHKFPVGCAALLKSMPGNHRCVDCGTRHPTWAAVSYGALLCLQCSGHHRSLGVQVSCVRSIAMDHVSLVQLLALLEGGNAQLQAFFERHLLTPKTLAEQHGSCQNSSGVINAHNVTRLRYKTKAALFYRQQLSLHLNRILEAGPYQGREQSRKMMATAATSSTTTAMKTTQQPLAPLCS